MTERRTYSPEVASDQLRTLFDFYDLDYGDADGEEIDGDQVGDLLRKQNPRFIRAIMKGRLEIVEREGGEVVVIQHLDRSPGAEEPLVYHELTGAAGLVASQNKIEHDDLNKQILALVAGMTRRELKEVIALKGRDYTLMHALGLLFFAA